jgi:hypothetical protein
MALAARPAAACGPFVPEPVFAHAEHPDYPLARYASGRLGVLQPTYDLPWLVLAWRTLQGLPLTPAQQAAVVDLGRAHALQQGEYAAETPDGLEDWRKAAAAARAAAAACPGGAPPEAEVRTSHPTAKDAYETYENCLPDAFETAARTLADRGKRDACAAADWLRAQDVVFANCGGDGPMLPEPAPAGAPDWLAQDRAYQRAAALFYGLDFDGAARALTAIAADAKSPWRGAAALAAARNEIRRASLTGAPTLDAALARLRAIQADPALAEWHASAARLERLALLRRDPSAAMKALGERLARPDPGPDLPALLTDYARLSDAGTTADDPLSAWLGAYRQRFGEDEAGPTDALDEHPWSAADAAARSADAEKRWRATKSPAWLVAALTWAPAGDHPDLIAAAKALPPTAPAWATAQYHAARLLKASGHADDARRVLDAALAADVPASARNLFADLRLDLATSWRELFDDAIKTEVARTYDEELAKRLDADAAAPRRKLFDARGALTVTRAVPAARLLELAGTAPNDLRRGLTVAAWTRALLVGDDATAQKAARAASSLDPAFARDLEKWLAEPTPEARRFAGVFLMAKLPGVAWYPDAGAGRWDVPLPTRLNVYEGRNWWCPRDRDPEYYEALAYETPAEAGARHPQTYDALVPPFATADADVIRAEWARLAEVGPAPDFFAREFVARAEREPPDPRLPEALHWAVYATRYGCHGPGTSAASKRAFQTLHRKYPSSPWAEKTPYHY